MGLIKISLISLFLIFSLSVDPISSSKQEYYRGIYDVCVFQGIKNHYEPSFVRKACIAYVKDKLDKGWYKKESTGWKWPIRDLQEQ